MATPLRSSTRVFVANRGEIARRIIRTTRRLGIASVAMYHPVDKDLPFVSEADEQVCVEHEQPVRAYLDGSRIIAAAMESGATAVHPGYGFMAENADFARAVIDAGLAWVGPPPDAITSMGDKVESRNLAARLGVPVGGGNGHALETIDDAIAVAEAIGYPAMLKASAGGGGIGMTVVRDAQDLHKAFDRTRSMATRSFGSDRVYLERFVQSARHVEVQVVGLADGSVFTLGERDCSVQRRHQKIVEESPPLGLDPALRAGLQDAAHKIASAVGYVNLGTVEFLVDTATQDYVFLEMNTRIQVEHPVTELTFGVDLVEQQLSIATTGQPTTSLSLQQRGHALELRVCAEDPVRFLPAPGPIDTWVEPTGEGVRVDSGFVAGNVVTPHFDPLLAKVCVVAPTRAEAIERADKALTDFTIEGLQTNIPFLQKLVRSTQFRQGTYDTNIVAEVQRSSTGNAGN